MALEGTLDDMSLEDLFQIFQTGAKCGVLLLSGDPERVVIYVYKGRLIDAVLVRGVDRRILSTGEDAVIQALQWEAGHFTFRHDLSVADRPSRITHDTEWLILEGIRRRENPLRILPHQRITMDTRLELAALPNGAESGVNLDLDQWRILSQVAICENMREICTRTGMEPDAAIRTVTELIAIGLVEVAPPEAPAPVPQPRARAAVQRQAMTPALAGAGAMAGQTLDAPGPQASRGLLGAIMRRIRGL